MTETRDRNDKRLRQRMEGVVDAVPKIGFWKPAKRFVVNSRGLALCIAHEHFNVTATARIVQKEHPGVANEFWWDEYYAKTGRWLPCVYIGRKGLIAIFNRFHNVPACRDIKSVLKRYLVLLDEAEGPAESAPDSEIKPPKHEPANLFDLPEPVENPAESWEINAAIRLLAKRTALPRYLRDDIEGWNFSRCKALAERVKDIDRISAIYATSKPE
jgi:hypothetical protein